MQITLEEVRDFCKPIRLVPKFILFLEASSNLDDRNEEERDNHSGDETVEVVTSCHVNLSPHEGKLDINNSFLSANISHLMYFNSSYLMPKEDKKCCSLRYS